MGGASYQYDGLNNRVQQTVGANVTQYLLDLQPGLAVVLAEITGANVNRNVHAPRGIHARKDAAGAWEWMVQDGLGSVRGVVDNSVGVLESRNYDPYGTGFDATGSSQTAYGFTGEPMDTNGLLYLRARYYNPAAGVFTALDPFEGSADRPMSLNGYSWVEGNVPNRVDPSGMIYESPYLLNPCAIGTSLDTCDLDTSCYTLITALSSPNGISEFMVRNAIMDRATAVRALISAWRNCPCEFFRGRKVNSTSNPLYQSLNLRLNGIRSDLQNLIISTLGTRDLWQPYVTSLYNEDYLNPVPCFYYEVTPSDPYLPFPTACTGIFNPAARANEDALLAWSFNPERIHSIGIVGSASQAFPQYHFSVGGGFAVMFDGNSVSDIDWNNCTGFFFVQGGANFGGDAHGAFVAAAFSNSTADTSFWGVSEGASADIALILASRKLPANLNLGLARSNYSCDFTAYYGLGTMGNTSISASLSWTPIRVDCKQIREFLGTQADAFRDAARVYVGSIVSQINQAK